MESQKSTVCCSSDNRNPLGSDSKSERKQKIAFNPHSFNVKIYPFLSFLVSPNSKIPKPPSTYNSYFAPFQKPDEIDIGKYLADEAVCSSDS